MLSAFILASLAAAGPRFAISGDQFMLDGKPFVIRSGEIHYPRVPRPLWTDRLKKAKAMGLNTVCTYVFWNAHEPTPGTFNFRENLDVAAFVREAQKQGLYVIVRPGPYVCTEWEWGGFPWWLAKDPAVKVRQNEPRFLAYSKRYLAALGKQLAPLQIERGGPIILTQVENEYGSFGNDHAYMAAIRDQIRDAGFVGNLFTSDGPGQDMLQGGTLPGITSVVNFGGDAEGAFRELAKFRPGSPRMCGEFWAGWFDHWGENHQTSSVADNVKDLAWMLKNGVSFNIYMFHGGTNWAFMNGANSGGKGYEPDVTSYDYDAAVSEDGRLTAKWHAFRRVIEANLPAGERLPDPPAESFRVAIPRFSLTESYALLAPESLGKPIKADSPLRFEALDHPYGWVLYRTTAPKAGAFNLEIDDLQDRAQVWIDGKPVGTLERRLGEKSLPVTVERGATIDLLVENQGRINFSRAMLGERKGFAQAKLGGETLRGWQMVPVSLDLNQLRRGSVAGGGPRVYFGSFTVAKAGDTNLDFRGWGKGAVWVNGRNLGRFWSIGAQQTLFLPGVWLKAGRNEIAVLDLEPSPTVSIQGLVDPVFERR